ncbi:MAG: F0F1 ATP synthase subunit epsilon [Dehalococcoidia bacterium]|nr:F0F1 ATP synthase subunit epsilon [Dehalococcoidia bacterium]
MATIKLEIITAEREVFADDVDVIVAPGIEGDLGILPHHAPLMTMLRPGELLIRKDNEETYMAITGGFFEVRPDRVILLADACERSDDIDVARAEAAKRRAEEGLLTHLPELDEARTEAALRRSLTRLKVATRRRRRAKPGL